MHPDQSGLADSEAGEPSSPGNAAASSNKLRILVVEDNRNLKDMLCDMLDVLGHVPQGASDAEEALALSELHMFDVLLTDVSLPGMSGIELAKQLIVKQPDMQIVFASDYGARMMQHIKLTNRVLPKPYDVAQIRLLLAELLPLAGAASD